MQQRLILNTHADTGAGAIVHHAKAMELNPDYRGIVFCDDGCGKAGERSHDFNQNRSFELIDTIHDYKNTLSDIVEQLNIPTDMPVENIFVMACNTLWISCQKDVAKRTYPNGAHVIGISDPLVQGIADDYKTNYDENGLGYGLRIALFGTQSTIDSAHYQNAIKANLPDAKVSAVACPSLASLVDKDAPIETLMKEVDKYVGKIRLPKTVTHVGLVCTHYSMAEDLFWGAFQARFAHDIKILDHPGLVEKSRLQYIAENILSPGQESIYPKNSIYITTGDPEKMNKAALRIQSELPNNHPFRSIQVKFTQINLPVGHIIRQPDLGKQIEEIIDLKNGQFDGLRL